MTLWTDLITPADLTGYARLELARYEVAKGTLARWLPNRFVADTVARFVMGQTGLIDIAKFRAYDAEPEVGRLPGGKRVTLELPALGQMVPVGELDQLRQRNASDVAQLKSVLKATDTVVHAVSDAIEQLRGVVLNTGVATIAQDNFISADDFGRPAGHTVTLTGGALWSAGATVSRLANLIAWSDIYTDANGVPPGALLMSTAAFRVFAQGNEFQTQLLNGGARSATPAEASAVVAGAGLPPIYLYDRRVSIGGTPTKVLPNTQVLLLPEPVDPNDDGGTELGATFWGQTLTSTSPLFGIEDSEQPGVVAGVYRGDKPPMIAEVISDAIGLPVLANSALSFSAKVI